MKKKKLVFIVLLVVIIGFVLFLYNAFNGNPISQYISKVVLENYLEETYPDQEFRIKEGFYNFKFSAYQYTVIEIGSPDKEGNANEFEFNVSGFFKPSVSWDGVYYENLDHYTANRFSREAQREITSLLTEKMDTIHLVEVQFEIVKGKFKDDVKWSKELTLDKPMEIFIQLDSSKQTKEDFLSTATKINSLLNEQDYDYESIMFNGSGFDIEGLKDDYLKYSLRIEKDGAVKIGEVEEHNEDMW